MPGKFGVILTFWAVLLLATEIAGAQPDTLRFLKMEISNGDTMLIYDMEEVDIEASKGIVNRYQNRRFTRLMRDVEITMPYAQLAAQKLHEIDSTLMTLETDRERRAYLDRAEDELMSEFESDLRSLNRRQGLLLIKLIDRQTGETTYHLLREYRSRWSAFFWQGMARVFGMNLRTKYDYEKEEDIDEFFVLSSRESCYLTL
jgi:hypothetical protein